MRLLADENFPLPTIDALRQAGHDVTWVRTDLPGTGDAAMVDIAEADGRVLLTLDKDFWQLAIQRRKPFERCYARWPSIRTGAGTPAWSARSAS